MEKTKYLIKERTEKVVLPEKLGFGQIFSDHMFQMDYSPSKGWYSPQILPVDNLMTHPASSFIHYGQTIFEGLKAFKTVKNEIIIFRPETHIERLNNSAKRICMPQVDVKFVLEALTELVRIDSDWIPTKRGESLYIRPFMYGLDPALGVRPSRDYRLVILLSPVGAYYPEGFKPVKILVQDDYVRAVRKGLGECKTAANYAASLLATEEAMKKGFTQVLWLDGVHQKYVEEVGTMNIFINFKDEVVTPKLNGSILPGVTRRSVIQILKEWGMKVTEREISIDEIISEYETGNLLGLFGSGTAAIISSIGWLTYKEKSMTFNNGEPGELDVKLFNELTSIHYGEKEDTHNWIFNVDKKGIEVS
ncbi:MAG: branched-chain amino acid aminotransferase [Ignavibacterium sp.]|nr:branched-chain amino acid aminotransferase [Ignavibacterium sp.]